MKTAKLGEDENGVLMAALPYTDQKMASSIETPSPDNDPSDEVGPIQRNPSIGSVFNQINLESFTFTSSELASTIKRFREEMYRNKFPVPNPSFQKKCEECGLEYDKSDVDECEECGSEDFTGPSRLQKHKYWDYFDSINKNGISLRQLMEFEEMYQAFCGVSTVVIKKSYTRQQREVRVGDNTVRSNTIAVEDYDDGEIRADEIIHADPRSVVPVTDANGRRGGWWTCPFHRGEELLERDDVTLEAETRRAKNTCEECGCRLEEVHFVHLKVGDRDTEAYYLNDEVVQWSRHFETQLGVTGMPPIVPLIRHQALLRFSRKYDLAFMDPDSQDLPNKMMLIYTEDPGSLRTQFTKEEQKTKENPIRKGRLVFDGDPEDAKVEMLDLTPQDMLKNRERKMEQMKKEIRNMFGLPDSFQNDFGQTGGLNSEGMQVEIQNRAVAAATASTKDRALDPLARIIGLTDWEIGYVNQSREKNQLNELQILQAIGTAKQEQVPYQVRDGSLELEDHEWTPEDEEESDETF